MKKTRKEGITLVALVITIIILLILSGVSIASLTGNGLFEKAKLAKEKQENAQIKENEILDGYVNEINAVISGSRNDIEFKSFPITISNEGIITANTTNINMKILVVIKDNKFEDYAVGNTYAINVESGKTSNVYLIGIDENMQFYKSNTVSYSGNRTYLYYANHEYENISGGWEIWHHSSAYAEKRLDCLYGSNTQSACGNYHFVTKSQINVSNYSTLKANVILRTK